MAPRGHEMDPLLIKESSTLSSTASTSKNKHGRRGGGGGCCPNMTAGQKRRAIPLVIGLVAGCFCVGVVILMINTRSSSSSTSTSSGTGDNSGGGSSSSIVSSNDRTIQSYTDPTNPYGYAEITSKGRFVVHYVEDIVSPSVDVDEVNRDGDNDDDAAGDGGSDNTSSNMIPSASTESGNYLHQQQQPTHFNRTFGELAQILLPPWHMASIVAVDASILDDTQPSNRTLKNARQVLKIGRDLLDVFSPVYPHKSIWKDLRHLYNSGYEKVGYYKDLSAAKIAYDEQLWTKRLDDVLVWKKKFMSFNQQHDVLMFLVGIQPDQQVAFEHKDSHLFWGELSTSHKLPRSGDSATQCFDELIKTQLQNSLDYYDIIINYKTVLTVQQQLDYHDLRKQLRDVIDEFNLLGKKVLLSSSTASSSVADKAIDTFKVAVKKIGDFHDEWTAYDRYKKQKTHFKQQDMLAESINKKWTDFKAWMVKEDLRGIIQKFLQQL